ncbi:MAG: competence/damage-inducible protein A [Magnetovibrio sp.]|nr:competence/damage-inducible protein A [Magnetovibrio sp.]|tara:strand:- start:413 stop:1165 length:753 start_codon:yes stop_codon:yes gene_type:complete
MAKIKIYTAGIVVIGNEVLSGRTQDANVKYLGERLNLLGIRLMEVRIIPDVETAIIGAVRDMSRNLDYVFTTGGIGPTHDDITAASIARAFGVNLVRDPEAERLVRSNYAAPEEVTPARLKMADVPKGATLLRNPISKAPGFQLKNVYVLPGIPRIMQAIFEGFCHELFGGEPIKTREITAFLPEGILSGKFEEIQSRFPGADLGSYPFVRDGHFGTVLVLRHTNQEIVDALAKEVRLMIRSLGSAPFED